MNLILIKTCENCGKWCYRWQTKPVSIGVHYPWAFCPDCYDEFRKGKKQVEKERLEAQLKSINEDRGF